MSIELGRLEQIQLRSIWINEARDFTPWLARVENLKLLGDALGTELELIDTECSVGEFNADIRCRDLSDDHIVLIENQLERTDHGHLGQLLTYAAGLEAVTIVWIASRFADAHRAALDWLNEITDESIQFFGFEVELWRIGESVPAPKFNVVSKPNDWSKSVTRSSRRSEPSAQSDLRVAYLEFWTSFREYLVERGSALRPQSARPTRHLSFSIGRAGFHLDGLIKGRERRIGAELYIDDSEFAHQALDLLAEEREAIQSEVGCDLEWIRAPRQAKVVVFRPVGDPFDQSQWPNYMAWIADMLERLSAAFRPRVLALPDFRRSRA